MKGDTLPASAAACKQWVSVEPFTGTVSKGDYISPGPIAIYMWRFRVNGDGDMYTYIYSRGAKVGDEGRSEE